jgi:alpha-L-rhamnosidase
MSKVKKELKVTYLRCEYLIDPPGIDSPNPRLSWILETSDPDVKGEEQTAYQIAVSSTKEKLKDSIADFWDTGKIISNASNQIEYNGKELKSRDECWWKVRIWNKKDEVTEWSDPAKWKMGLLSKSDWKAKWIGYDEYEKEEEKKEKLEFVAGEDKWIWYPLDKTEYKKGRGKYFFRKIFEIKNVDNISSAEILITADESSLLYLNGKKINESDNYIFSWTRPKKINIKPFLNQEKNILSVECLNTYLEKPGLAVRLFLQYNNGEKQLIVTDKYWKASNKLNDGWGKIEFNDGDWIDSEVVAVMGEKPWHVPKTKLFLPPPPYLRKEFEIKKKIKSAHVFISSLGLHKLYINGKSVSDDRLTPGWTNYNKRVYYNTYDVKEYLKNEKNNCLGIILADGWYSGYIGWEKRREYYGKNPRTLLQLEIEYEDGTNETIVTDESWKAFCGSITEADLLMGETYDAKKEKLLDGWNNINFKNKDWNKAEVSDEINIVPESYPAKPIRKRKELKPLSINSPAKGTYIFDFGQNFAGSVQLKIDGRKTDKIVLRFGEMLDADGNLYTTNIRMARATDTYLTKGEKEEIWEPLFTYHGFRYVEITGYPEKPVTEILTAIAFHSDIPVTGSFECSNEKLNRLYDSIFWSQRSNFMDIPTDCPQRDERLGWTADAVDFIRTASFNMDTSLFYTKWLRDLNDAQEENGAYPAIAPKPDLGVGPLYSGAAGFADSGIITPYFLYKYYGDIKILQRYYENMMKFMEYLEMNKYKRPGNGYGDWLSVNADTPQELIDAAFFAYDAKLMSEISFLLNKPAEVGRFKILNQEVKNYFQENFVNKDGSIKCGTQTAYSLAIYFGLLNKETEIKSFEFLVRDIEERDYHISTGFIGLSYLFPVLTKFGRGDIVYKLLLNESFPSWLNMLNNGATTMWERWDSWTPDKGFFDPLMNSFNHTSLGVIGEWFYSGIGGIIPEEPGFKRFIVNPMVGGDLNFAKVNYFSIYGKISSEWKIEDDKFSLKVEIPVNTSAKIFLPKTFYRSKFEKDEQVKLLEENENFFVFEVHSGKYNFVIQ